MINRLAELALFVALHSWALCLTGCGKSGTATAADAGAMTDADQRNFRAVAECVIQYGGEKKKYPGSVAEAVADCGDADLIEWVKEKDANLFLPQGAQEYQSVASGRVLGWRHTNSRKSVVLLVSGAAETLDN